MKAINIFLLIAECVLLLLLVLSDFGLILPSENTFARVLLHFSVLFLIISTSLQLKKFK